ncbi:MAG: ATP-grasp domain-containing protein [Chloroflexota bacterium]
MTDKILVTSPRITPDSTILMKTAKSVSQEAMRLPSFRPTDGLEGQRIAIYGESLFAIILSSALDHVVLEPSSDWLTTLPCEYRQREIILTTIAQARRYPKPRFIKNADGMKAFEPKVFSSGADLPSSEFYPDDYGVLVSDPVYWEAEYRCFVLNRSIQTLSVYLRDGQLAKSDDDRWLHDGVEQAEAQTFCERLLQDKSVKIPRAVVIDVGKIKGKGWAVIEANPAYGSGIYGCDPLAVLQVINLATLHTNDVQTSDEQWITHYEVD